MIKFFQSTPVGGDCTCGYSVTLDKTYTVKEFIQAILNQRRNECGNIGIQCSGTFFGKPYLEYQYGKIVSEEQLEAYNDSEVASVKACGG